MGDLLLEVNNLYQCYEKNKLILQDINLCVNNIVAQLSRQKSEIFIMN